MTKTVKNSIRFEVRAYFVELSVDGQIDSQQVADGEMADWEHAEEILRIAEERGVDLAAKHGLDKKALLDALTAECAEVIAQAIENFATIEAAEQLIKEVRELTDEEAEELNSYIDNSGFPVSFDVEFEGDRVSEVSAVAGHFDGNEWHGTDKTLEELRGMTDGELHALFVDHIEIAIENHRDGLHDDFQCDDPELD